MSDPTLPQDLTPGVPPPPPELNTRRLWITLLAPSAVMVLIMVLLFLVMETLDPSASEFFFTASCIAVCIVSAVSWGFFIHTISQRFHGTSLILLILAYPILQGVLVFAIFFVGCFAIISAEGVI